MNAGNNPAWVLATAAAAALLLGPATAFPAAVALPGDRQQVLINLTGGLPGRWDSCRAVCQPGEDP
ncbi:MAG: hypothetical protein OEW72_03735, partial [Gammaproteobacteria bacterium]|nr:hypothetical protein [Gammaproteobacteria bacterium]